MQSTINVFVDESGDLGFSRKSSKYFVIGFIIPQQPERLRTTIKRVRKKVKQTLKKKGKINEFKFSKDSDKVKEIVFNSIFSKYSFDVGLIVIQKNVVTQKLRDDPKVLYNYLAVHYVITSILSPHVNVINYTIDKSRGRNLQQEFNSYVKNKVSYTSRFQGVVCPTVIVNHVNSFNEPCIQLADYVAGATFWKFERKNSKYYDILVRTNKIKYKRSWGDVIW